MFCFCKQFLWAQMTTDISKENYQQLQERIIQVPTNANFSEQIQFFTLLENKKNGFALADEEKQMPLVYAYKDLAFFCKIEVQLERAVKLPVKFRLGSVDYVDYLEGKRYPMDLVYEH